MGHHSVLHGIRAKCWPRRWGNKSSEEVHGYPLDLLDLYFEAPVEGEPNIAALKAWRPIFDESVHVHPTPLPGPDATTNNFDAYTRALVLLKGEQNSILPCEGCEQHAAPCTPQNFLLPLSLDACMCGIVPGESVTSI